MKYWLSCLTLVLFSFQSVAQETDHRGYYLVEFEKFTPPVKDMIASFEGSTATPFMAKNMEGKELYLGDYSGKNVVMLFWSINNGDCLAYLYDFNRVARELQSECSFVSFSDESRADMEEFLQSYTVDFEIIPNSKIFGEMAYASDLGTPRIFVVGQSGKIKKVIPAEAFYNTADIFELIKSVLKDSF